jgi:heme/copper-type cytochrome/quinol oxidase subunit 2/ferredoxin
MSSKWILLLFVGLAGLVLFAPLPLRAGQPAEHHLTLEARSFAFEPGVIQVNEGDRVILELESMDVTHGVYIDGYQLEAVSEPGRKARLDFVADQVGKFKYRCSIACGTLHPFMIGELVVRPNFPYWRAIALVLLAAVGSVLYLWRGSRTGQAPADSARQAAGQRIELTGFPLLKRVLRWRGFQPTLMLVTLFGFVLAVMTSFFGTPVGSRNFAIVYVWIVWWALLKIVLVPLTGRLWCTMCPIPGPGEWLQRRGILVKREGKLLSLGRKWPRKLANVWPQNVSLLAVMVFSPIILTLPLVTGIVLLVFIGLAIALSLVFERRAFCRYVCPVGGFIGLYSMVASVELRVNDTEVCLAHRGKECYLGSADGYGCPWLVKPWRLQRNAHCGLCTECLKTCPKDNVAVNLRPFGSDLLVKAGRGLDEAYTALIMLASALLFSAIFLGPWGWLKEWAGVSSLSGRVLYAGAFLAINVLVVPGFFLLATALSKGLSRARGVSLNQLFVNNAYALVPMGLSMWIAFSVTFLSVSGSYAVSVISDPFGWGWDLFGTRLYPWTLYLPKVLPYLQVVTLIAGLVFSIAVAYRIGQETSAGKGQAIRGVIPIAGFLTVVTVIFLQLYLG